MFVWYSIYHILAFYLKYSLQGKIILITGCDTGFGNALTKKLDSLGSIVFATCLNEKTAKELDEKTSHNVHIIMMDVTKIEDINNGYKIVKKYCIDNKSALYGIVNNAGIAANAPFECTERKSYTKVIDVDLIGLINVTRAFLPLIRIKKYNPYIGGKYASKFGGFYQRGKAGRVINVASVAGRVASPYISSYNAAKFGVVGFTAALRYELDKFFNIWCCTVEPFFVMTNIVKEGMNIEKVKDDWMKVKKPDAIDDEFEEVKQNENGDVIEDDVDDIMDVYDVEKYIEWKKESNRFIKGTAIKSTDQVINAIICALSSVYPLKVYYPSFRATIIVRLFKYVIPGWLIEKDTQKRIFTISPIKDSFKR